VNKWYTYVVRCRDSTLYTGVTTDISRRLSEHNASIRGAKYTKKRRPVKLVYWSEHQNRSAAQREEYRIKRLSKQEKERLIVTNTHMLEVAE
jgi:putative endonuclease